MKQCVLITVVLVILLGIGGKLWAEANGAEFPLTTALLLTEICAVLIIGLLVVQTRQSSGRTRWRPWLSLGYWLVIANYMLMSNVGFRHHPEAVYVIAVCFAFGSVFTISTIRQRSTRISGLVLLGLYALFLHDMSTEVYWNWKYAHRLQDVWNPFF